MPEQSYVQNARRTARMRALLVLLGGLLVAALVAWRQDRENQLWARARFEQEAERVCNALVARMLTYEYGLRGTRGVVLAAGDQLSQRQFTAYAWSRDLHAEFPGARGFGFVRRVAEPDVPRFVEAARRDSGPDFSIRQLAPHAGERWVIQYIEPRGDNRQAVGLDIASEQSRRTAALEAMHAGKATLTAPITLLQAAGAHNHGFLLVLPVYAIGQPLASAAERSAATLGWTYTPLVIDEVLSGFDLHNGTLSLALTDSAARIRFYDSGSRPVADGKLGIRLERQVFGRVWNMDFHAAPGFLEGLHLLSPARVFHVSALLALLLAALLYAFLLSYHKSLLARAQQARLGNLVENSSDAIIAESLDGVITSWNRAAEQIFGYAAHEAVGRTAESLGLAEALPEEREKAARARQGEPLAPFDAVRMDRHGRARDVSIALIPLRSPAGAVVGLGRTIRDATDRKLAERQRRELSAQLEQQVAERTAELDAARRDLQTILDAVPSVIAYWDADGVNRFANRACHDLLGVPPGSLPGRNLREVLGEERYGANRADIEAALAGQARTTARSAARGNAATQRELLTHYFPDRVGSEVRGFYVISHDVTELQESQRRLRAALRDHEALLNALHETALVSVTDRTGTIIDVNERFCSISGYCRDELVGSNHRLINSGVHPRAFWVEMWKTIASGQIWRGAVCNRAKDGSLYYVDSVVMPFLDDAGRVERYVSIRTDITEQRQALDALALERERLDNILRGTHAGTWEWNVQTGETRVNERWAEMIGYTLEELAPITIETWVKLAQPEDLQRSRATLARHFAGEVDYYECEYRLRHKDGALIWVLDRGSVSTWTADGKPEWMYGTHLDVTERHTAEDALRRATKAAQAASAAKSEFLANVSHEIRTPLNAVIGLSYLLERTGLSAEQRDHVAKIQASGRLLLSVINDVLDLSKIEAGEMSLEDTSFDLAAVFEELGQMLAPQAAAKQLDLLIPTLATGAFQLRGDPTRLTQILANLLSNAIKFTQRGSVELSVTTEARDERRMLRLAVRDTGIGIEPDVLQRLFTPFTQADASTTRRFGGTGLGLSIVRHLAEMMGGTAGVTSQLGQGSVFWVEVPLREAAPASPSGARPFEVLVAHENPTTRDQLCEFARSLGWQATATASSAALQRCVDEWSGAAEAFGLLVVSHALPGEGAQALLAQVRGSLPEAAVPAALIIGPPACEPQAGEDQDATPKHDWVTPPNTASEFFDAVGRAVLLRYGSYDKLLAVTRLEASGGQWLCGVQVLLVDDSDINIDVARSILRHEGAEVTACSNGSEALAAVQRAGKPFDVVLMDVHMPVMDGYEATRRLRKDMGMTGLPIIALTAGALVAERQRALAAGMNDFLTKPLDPSELVRSVRAHAERARAGLLPVVPRRALEHGEASWPQVDGIDTEMAKRRLMNDREMFLGMLGRMLREYVDLYEATPPVLTSSEARELLRIRAHKLRGTSGMLAANEVHRLAAATEEAIDAELAAEQIAPTFAALRRALGALSRSARPVLEAQSQAVPHVVSHDVLDVERLKGLLLSLQANDLAALDQFAGLLPTLQSLLDDASLQTLRRAIEDLNFSEACALLQAWKSESWMRAS